MRSIDITDVGAIQKLSIPIPEEGGVVVLKGRNGSGKSTALEVSTALMEGQGGFEPRDGQERGSVVGLGCEIAVRKQTRHAGTLEVQRIQGEDPALLVDPGMSDPVANDKARIRALCRLAKVEPSKELFASLEEIAGVPLPITVGADVPESAAKTKRAIEAKARDVEELATKNEGRIQGLLQLVSTVVLESPHDAQALSEQTEEAVRSLATAEGQAQTSRQALQTAQMAQEALDQAMAAAPRVSAADAEAKHLAACQAEEAAQRAHRDAQEAKRTALAEVKAILDYERAVAGWQASIDAAKGITAADDEALASMRLRVQAAKEAEALGRDVRRALEQKHEAETVAEEMKALRSQAERLRHAASCCDAVVSDAIGKVAPRGLTVEGDRLMVEHARGRIPFADLSHGERWHVALDVAIDAVGEGGLLSIDQEAWEGLDDERRQEIAEHARARRAVILTAEASMSELTAEVLQ
jgi:hypothetical protein